MNKIYLLTSCAIFIIAMFIVGQNINKPFWGEHDWNGVRYGNIARNYLRYGFIETKLGQVENSGIARVGEFGYYTHYPPLLPILISISYTIFGISEFSTRLVPLLATSGTIALIFLIGAYLYNFKIGLLASLLALATPMVLYFGKNSSHEPLTTFFILLSFWGYINITKANRKIFQILFLVGLILAQLTAWAGYFLVPALTIPLIVKKDWLAVKKLIPYLILSIILFFVHLIHVTILTGSISGGNLIGSLMQRSGISPDVQPSGFNILGYLDKLRLWFSTLYTATLTLLSFSWLFFKRGKFEAKDLLIISLGLIGLIYICVFSNSVFIHNYLIFYFLPFLVLSAALCIVSLMNINFFEHIKILLPLFIVLIVFFEKRDFLLALNLSHQDKLAVEIGKAINNQTKPSDEVLILPYDYSNSSDRFLKFYSDRRLNFSDSLDLSFDIYVIVNTRKQTFTLTKKQNP